MTAFLDYIISIFYWNIILLINDGYSFYCLEAGIAQLSSFSLFCFSQRWQSGLSSVTRLSDLIPDYWILVMGCNFLCFGLKAWALCSLFMAFVLWIGRFCRKVETSNECRGLIFTSSTRKCFLGWDSKYLLG